MLFDEMDQANQVPNSSFVDYYEENCVTLPEWFNKSPDTRLELHGFNMTVNFTALRNVYFSVPVYGYVTPILFLITLLTNTLVVCVLSRPHMKSPSNFILCAIAVSDLLTLGLPVPMFIYQYTLGKHTEPVTCLMAYLDVITTDILPTICHSASIWLTLQLAIQRYIYVCHPNVARTWCTIARVTYGTIAIYVVATLYNFPRLFEREFKSRFYPWNCQMTEFCVGLEKEWQGVFLPVFYWFRVIFVNVMPCVLLLIVNTFLVAFLNKAQAARKRLFRERKQESAKQRDSNGTTMMLVAIVFVFLAVELPLAMIVLIFIVQNTWKLEIVPFDRITILITFSNLCIALSYSIYFPIYCSMSRQFRDTFKELFVKAKQLGADARNGRRVSVSQQRRLTIQQNGALNEFTALVSVAENDDFPKNATAYTSTGNNYSLNPRETETLL